jgi:hypothetical protein
MSVAAGSYLAGIPGALFSVPILAVANSAIRYIAARTWEHELVPAAAGTADLASADEDTTFREVRLPGAHPGHGKDADRTTGAPGSSAAPGSDVESPKGE